MTRVGLTGGIGSGKTTVAKIFELLGVPVYYADDAARRIMNEDIQLRTAILEKFGEAAYQGNQVDRTWLAAKVFNDASQLEALNSLVHPATIRDAAIWMASQATPYAIKEAALIFESGSNSELDYVIGVSAPRSLRIARIVERNKITVGEIEKRMARQLDEEAKMKRCDFVIYNDEQQLLIPQVLALHKKFLKLAGKD